MCFIYLGSDSDSVRVPYAAPRRRFPSRSPFISKGKEGGRTALTPHPLAPVTSRHSGFAFSEQLSFFSRLGFSAPLDFRPGTFTCPCTSGFPLSTSHVCVDIYLCISSPPLSFGWLFKPDFTPFESLGLPTIKNQESYGHRIGAIWKIWKTDENNKIRIRINIE